MSGSRSRSRVGSGSRVRARSSAIRLPSKKKPSAVATAAHAPWIRNGIDYGPARAAIGDLAAWVFALAERATEDWPTGRVHVRNTRAFVEARLADRPVRRASVEDVMFTAELLARIFDDDLELDRAEMLAIFEQLALPTDALPLATIIHRAAPTPASVLPALIRVAPSLLPTLARIAQAPSTPPAAPATPPPSRLDAPPPLRFCDDCGYVHEPGDHIRYRNAA